MDIIFPIYNPDQVMFQRHIDEWKKCGSYVRAIIIDDASDPPFNPTTDVGITTKVARVKKNIQWHAEGAINLGFLLANDDWCILLNFDHLLAASEIFKACSMKKEQGNIYIFNRVLPDGRLRNKNVTGVCVIHRNDWLRIRGYDEDFCGMHGCADWLALGSFYGGYAKGNPSVAKSIGLNYVQTDIRIIEYKNHGCNLPRKGRNANYDKYDRKVRELKKGTYINKRFVDFEWELLKP